MEYRQMGRTGLRVSEICLGTMTFAFQTAKDEAFAIMDTAVEAGVNFIDTSDVYPLGSPDVGTTEEIVGEWLATKPRDSIVLATKCRGAMSADPNDQGLSRKHILDAVNASLRRLGTDYIDLYQSHFPDSSVPIEETMRAYDDLVRWGKVRYVGASNYQAWELATALSASDALGVVRYECDQPRYNMLFREIDTDLLPLCRHEGVGVIAYNPLAAGLLTGKYETTDDLREGTRFMLGGAAKTYQARYWDDPHFREVARLKVYFSQRDTSLTHAAIAWVLAQDGISSAIVGASRREQIEDSLKAVEIELTQDDLDFCDAAWWNLPRRPDQVLSMRP